MSTTNRGTLLTRSLGFQISGTLTLWVLLGIYIYIDSSGRWDSQVSLASFIAIPAAIIVVTQLVISTYIQRASYIKDYAIRFRTEKELSESFHFLVYKFGNTLYETYIKDTNNRTAVEKDLLEAAQEGVKQELQFFDPKVSLGTNQERRLDNLLGFFDTIGYDYARNLLQMRDIAGVFGYQLDHFIQRKVVQDYLNHLALNWPQISSFHAEYSAPVPFRYLSSLLRAYVDYRKAEAAKTTN